MHERNAMLCEQRPVADTRQLQQLRRIHSPCRQDHFALRSELTRAAVLLHDDTRRPPVRVEQYPRDEYFALDGQIPSVQHGVQILETARRALAIARIDVVNARTFELRAVEVVGASIARLLAAREKHVADGMYGALHRRNADWSICAVILGVAERMRFELAEIRQDVAIRPALVARLRPVVVVARLAAHIDHRVDRAGAALHLAARTIKRTVVEFLLGLAVVHPVIRFVVVRLREADWNLEPERIVRAPRFQQQH